MRINHGQTSLSAVPRFMIDNSVIGFTMFKCIQNNFLWFIWLVDSADLVHMWAVVLLLDIL